MRGQIWSLGVRVSGLKLRVWGLRFCKVCRRHQCMLVTYIRDVSLSRLIASDRVTKGKVSCQERAIENCVFCTTKPLQPSPGLRLTPHFRGEIPATCVEGEGILHEKGSRV